MRSNGRVMGGGGYRQGQVGMKRGDDKGESGEVIDERPRSVYELVTRQMLEELKSDMGEVKGRVNTLLWLTAGAIMVDLVSKVVK